LTDQADRARSLPRIFAVAAALLTAGFLVFLGWLYQMRFSVGAVFLVIGWASLLGFGYLLARAVQTFDAVAAELPAKDLGESRRDELMREKAVLLKAIKETEFDVEMGKLDQADAADSLGRYRARAIEILRLLDETRPVDYEAEVERELARRLEGGAPATVPVEVKASAQAQAQATATATATLANACPACGLANDADAAFCKKCGAKLQAEGGA
jgi:hypothetical protein